jgi:hypothetical protein
VVLVEPEQFQEHLVRIEHLEDVSDGHQAIDEYQENPDIVVDAEKVSIRIGQ